MLGQRRKEQLKLSVTLGFIPFLSLLYHAGDLAFVQTTVNPHPAQVIFAALILVILAMRLPYVSNNRLLLSQVLSVFILMLLLLFSMLLRLQRELPFGKENIDGATSHQIAIV